MRNSLERECNLHSRPADPHWLLWDVQDLEDPHVSWWEATTMHTKNAVEALESWLVLNKKQVQQHMSCVSESNWVSLARNHELYRATSGRLVSNSKISGANRRILSETLLLETYRFPTSTSWIFGLGTEHVNKHTHAQPFYDEILTNVITIKQHQTACTSHHEQSKQTIKNILQSCCSIHIPIF